MITELRTDGVRRSGGRMRRAALVAGAAAGVALLVSGCGAGQVAETARKAPSVPGGNGQATVRDPAGAPAGTVSVRNVQVIYGGPGGYPRGGNAPLDVRIFNDTTEEVTVTVSSEAARSVVLTGGAAAPPPTRAPGPTESASPGPDGSVTPSPQASPSAPAGEPARLTIPANSYAVLDPDQARFLRLVGLVEAMPPGGSVPLVFDFGGGVTIDVSAPMAVPLTPLPRATPDEAEGAHG